MPVAGGTARAYIFPRIDSVVWSAPDAPPLARVLGFDPDDGVVTAVDDRGLPRRIDLRAGEVRTASKVRLKGLTSINGSDVYGITDKGFVSRMTPTGDWVYEPPSPAVALFPQPNGSLIIAGNEGGKTNLWLIRPTDDAVVETTSLPLVSTSMRIQLGDRLYFAVDTGLVGVRSRDLVPVNGIALSETVKAVVPTPSGDRLFVAVERGNRLLVIDRYTEAVTESVELPGSASALRMDPLGQFLLIKPARGEGSFWVMAIGTDRLVGTVDGEWRPDLPGFAPASAIANARAADVVFLNPRTLAATQTVANGARDYWYFFAWNGFRPRAADLDRPVTFESPKVADTGDSAVLPSRDSIPSPPLRDASPTMIPPPVVNPPRPAVFMVSFAAVLSEQKANETAAAISVDGQRPRVSAAQSGSTTIYRVVMGPYPTRDEAERVGRNSGNQFWVYEDKQ